MNTIALGIVASIFAGLAVILSQTNHLQLSIIFGVLFVIFSLLALFVHRKETSKTKADKKPIPPIAPDALIVSKLSHPDLRERNHRASVLGCTVFNKSGQKGAITKVNAYDKRNNLMNVTWSNKIDDFGNPVNPSELIGIIDQASLFIRANVEKEISFCKLEILHTFSDTPLTVTFDEYAVTESWAAAYEESNKKNSS